MPPEPAPRTVDEALPPSSGSPPPVAPQAVSGAAPAPPSGTPRSVLDGGPAGDSLPPVPQDWPDDWREKAAAGDEKQLARLARYASPQAALKALGEAQNRIAAGLKHTPFPADATPEQAAAWRAEAGIPATPEEYDLALPGGYVIGEEDKEPVSDFLKHAHDANMHPEQVKSALNWYYENQEKQVQLQAQADAESFRETEEALRQEWGADYRRNVNLAASMLDAAPAGVKENLIGARLADGTPLGNHPDVLRWLSGLARELNPLATVVPGSGATAAAAVENEIAAIEARMGGDKATRDAYFKDEKAQARYRELIAVRSKVR